MKANADFTDRYNEKAPSDFSASFYGPLYEETEGPLVEVINNEEDGYFYVDETHIDIFNTENEANMIRYYFMTKKDKRERTCLHLSAMFGDKDFTTMLIFEADKLGFGGEIVDLKDREGLTPLYLLAEEGYRKRESLDEQEE